MFGKRTLAATEIDAIYIHVYINNNNKLICSQFIVQCKFYKRELNAVTTDLMSQSY